MISEPCWRIVARRARGLLLLLVLWLSSSQLAAADGSDDAAYRELVEQALSEFRHKNWPEARALFVRAHAMQPNARTLRGIGVVSFEMRDYLSAVANLAAALEDKRQPLSDSQRKECENLLTRSRTFVGSFELSVEPADAVVELDDGPLTRDSEGRLLVPFGEHVLSATAPGYQKGETRVAVQGGERGTVSLTLMHDLPGDSPVAVAASPVVSTAAPTSAAPSSSAATAGPVAAEAPRRFGGEGLKYSWVALGAGAALGGAAALFWVLGDDELGELDAKCRRAAGTDSACTEGNTNTDSVKRYERLTNASIGLSAAALVTASVLMVYEWPRERRVSVAVGPQALFIRGAF